MRLARVLTLSWGRIAGPLSGRYRPPCRGDHPARAKNGGRVGGRALPCAIFAMLVVYCLKDVTLLSGSHGLPEALGIAVTILLHKARHQMLLSIAGGTICYMVLVQMVFK